MQAQTGLDGRVVSITSSVIVVDVPVSWHDLPTRCTSLNTTKTYQCQARPVAAQHEFCVTRFSSEHEGRVLALLSPHYTVHSNQQRRYAQ